MKKITFLFLFCILSIYGIQASNSSLYNYTWAVGRINEVTINPAASTTINFSSYDVIGTAYCNEFLGPFEDLGNNRISVGLLRLTRRICEFSNYENYFVTTLQSADSYQINGNILILRSGDKVVLECYPEGTGCPWEYDPSQEPGKPEEPEVPEVPVISGYKYYYDASGNRTLRETIYLVKGKSMANVQSLPANEKEDNDAINEYERPIEKITKDFELKIYPNPVKETLKIDVNGEKDIQNALIEIYTVNGKRVHSTKDIRTNYQINLSNQPGGVYIMRIILNDTPYEWTVVKD